MKMNELKDFLYQEIPLIKAMGVQVHSINDSGAVVSAPLAQNDNHMGTGFGGSLSALLITSCYAWLFYILSEQGFFLHVLIKSGQTDYHFPVKEDLKAICVRPSKAEFDEFMDTFKRKGKGKLILTAYVETADGKACSFKGEFVARIK